MDVQAEAATGDASTTPQAPWALTSLSLSMVMPALGTSVANAGLPSLAQAFDASFQQAQWIVLAYLLTITALIVSVGRLGDIVGRRRLLLAGIGLFTVASLLCGIAPGLWLLIAARALQGLGAAIMMALTVTFVGEIVPQSKTGSAMGLLGTMSAIGTMLGPSLGGALIATIGWPAIFLVNVPLGLATLLLARGSLPLDRTGSRPRRDRIDAKGTLLLALALAAYALAMTMGRGRFDHVNAVLMLTAVLGSMLFMIAERKAAFPLVPLKMLGNASLRSNLAMSLLVATVMMATLVVGPFYLSRTLGLGVALVGLALSVGPLAAALAGVPAGRMVDRLGSRRIVITGLLGMAAACVVLALMPARFGIAGYLAPIVVMTTSYALFMAANTTMTLSDLPPDLRGVMSGLLSLSRNLGLITGASAMGAIFALASSTTDITAADPAAVSAGMRITFAVAASLMALALAIALSSRDDASRGRTLTQKIEQA